jgi:hypothetical protein
LGPWLADPLEPLPDELSKLGNYEKQAVLFTPEYPLWTSGSDKERFIALPKGEVIDTSGDEWAFPDGAMLLKRFSWSGQAEETRILRRVEGEWDYAVYIHDGDDAVLWDEDEQVSVSVSHDGEDFDHVIPNRLDCRTCHEAHPDGVIGADALQLGGTLGELTDAGLFADEPASQDPITSADALLEPVLTYVQGNCVHCHDGGTGPNNGFDLRPDVFVENTVGQPTDSLATASGIRVVAGSPEASILFQAVSGETDDAEVKAMPPLGVQLRDEVAIEALRTWITSLETR